jgi:hypothetical protein
MPAIVFALAILLACGIVLLSVRQRATASTSSANSAATTPAAPDAITAEAMKTYTQAELASMLARLEARPAPKVTRMGAMCYDMSGPPDRVEYICPVCGERTLYPTREQPASVGNEDRMLLGWSLPACRRLVEEIRKTRKLDIALDETSFCRLCKPSAPKHEIILTVKYPDRSTHASPIAPDDLRILRDFVAGKALWTGAQDDEHPVKENTARLRVILGLPALETKP